MKMTTASRVYLVILFSLIPMFVWKILEETIKVLILSKTPKVDSLNFLSELGIYVLLYALVLLISYSPFLWSISYFYSLFKKGLKPANAFGKSFLIFIIENALLFLWVVVYLFVLKNP